MADSAVEPQPVPTHAPGASEAEGVAFVGVVVGLDDEPLAVAEGAAAEGAMVAELGRGVVEPEHGLRKAPLLTARDALDESEEFTSHSAQTLLPGRARRKDNALPSAPLKAVKAAS